MTTLIHHRVDGSGPALLLLHAGVADSRMWAAQVPALSHGHRVVTCDLRGFGRTPVHAGDDFSDVEDLLVLLDRLDVSEFDLVGASYGGSVALQLASAVPERVRRMVLLSTAADLVEPGAELRAFGAEEGRLLDAGDVEAATDLNVRTWVGPEADDATRDLVREMQRDAFTAQLPAGETQSRTLPVALETLTGSVTVVAGAHDFPFFVETAHALVRELPDARLVELPWAGHLPSLERPEEITDLLLDWLG